MAELRQRYRHLLTSDRHVAKATGWTLVTRNVKDMVGHGARLLNPFTDPPTIIEADDRID